MFAATRKAINNIIANNKPVPDDLFALTSSLTLIELPATYSLNQIHQDLVEYSKVSTEEDELLNVLALKCCLQHPERLVKHNNDAEYVSKISLWLSKVILPNSALVTNDEAPAGIDDEISDKTRATRRAKYLSQQGLDSLSDLMSLDQVVESKTSCCILLNTLAFTDSRDPWVANTSLQKAKELQDRILARLNVSDFISEVVLKDFIRPLFSKTQSAAITTSGRKAMATNSPRKQYSPADLDPTKKPWKFKEIYANDMVSHSWPLFIPPLLALLDDPNTDIKVRGLEILASFLQKFPAKLLKQTGLGDVFEDTVMPILLYLPNLTPVDESLKLLEPAYHALYSLAELRFPTNEEYSEKIGMMDRIMVHGVLRGYDYSKEQPQIVQVLIEQMNTLVNKLLIHSIKHLKDTLPILSTILTDPFGASNPALLLVAIETMKSIILNGWPRMTQSSHRADIIKSLALCWIMVNETLYTAAHSSDSLKLAKQELQVTGKLFTKAVECCELDIRADLELLFEADHSLSGFFGIQIHI